MYCAYCIHSCKITIGISMNLRRATSSKIWIVDDTCTIQQHLQNAAYPSMNGNIAVFASVFLHFKTTTQKTANRITERPIIVVVCLLQINFVNVVCVCCWRLYIWANANVSHAWIRNKRVHWNVRNSPNLALDCNTQILPNMDWKFMLIFGVCGAWMCRFTLGTCVFLILFFE